MASPPVSDDVGVAVAAALWVLLPRELVLLRNDEDDCEMMEAVGGIGEPQFDDGLAPSVAVFVVVVVVVVALFVRVDRLLLLLLAFGFVGVVVFFRRSVCIF